MIQGQPYPDGEIRDAMRDPLFFLHALYYRSLGHLQAISHISEIHEDS